MLPGFLVPTTEFFNVQDLAFAPFLSKGTAQRAPEMDRGTCLSCFTYYFVIFLSKDKTIMAQ